MDEKLIAWLIDEQAPALELYARQWCDCPQDVVQEALLELLRQGESPQRLIAWLFRVVRNRAISAGRSSRRRKRREAEASVRRENWFVPAADDRLDAEVATAALAELPLEQRETILAHMWGGLSFEEVAELTGVSSSTAHRRYQAALAVLRTKLGAGRQIE